ncbi:tripartite tricarboxylate transporter substrate binding protein [Paralcaligenes sp. KSB-10]|jgi:tripartite-type tricarboxylate transporter receptor subunit TctC|uniref:Bug family tripartite tricarboxylate transporter substrate binding protein n=1 Tax=Paralcaligenes sp. KSB-10 TaxID=2901142 RepID=UPI001E2BFE0D|nr:tripartite tricarboxylate transporter substrate binding protein [Paralcaligenes sp. KSB-10]UHL65063.1 tripartite tricarboxylate transporter substrate binding protein [Paralcaligenes sp. KSB-10]
MKLLNLLRMAGLALGASVAVHASFAQGYPARPVHMIVPFPPGSATDMAARLVGKQLQSALGQSFVIENKPGAGGSIGAMEVVRAAPDGYTMMFASNSAIASNVALLKNIPYNPNKDFTPLSGAGETSLVLMVKPDFPAKNLREFIAYVKQRPGKLSAGYGSSSSQICISLLDKMAGLDVLSVPYKGIPLAVNDVLGGTLDFTFVDLGNAMAQAKGGKLRPIAITSEKRSTLAPDWPTLSEELPGYNITAWFAMVGPAGIPSEVVAKLHTAMTGALQNPELKERFGNVGVTPMAMAPEQLKGFIASEIDKWKKLAKDANIEPK